MQELGYCVHDLLEDTCEWCTERQIVKEDVYGIATYFSKCDRCRRQIVPGEAIGLLNDAWGCEACIKKEMRARR
jgi:hypothetical protein